MADMQNYSLTKGISVQNLTGMPVMTVTARVVDSNTGALIADFTGANSFELLAEIKNRTPEQQNTIFNMIAKTLVRMKAGLE